jgi:hypothetical protein
MFFDHHAKVPPVSVCLLKCFLPSIKVNAMLFEQERPMFRARMNARLNASDS